MAHAKATSFHKSPQQFRPLEDLVGIRPHHLQRIQRTGIHTVEGLVANANSTRSRMFLAEKTGLTARQIMELLTLADLTRIADLTCDVARVLKSLGFESTADLADADMDWILDQLNDLERVPRETLLQIETMLGIWVAEARLLPRLLD